VQVVRALVWPSKQAPVYFTGGEDARICAWSLMSAEETASAMPGKRGLHCGSSAADGKQKKRRKQDICTDR
jgi:hypothetical protein